MVYIVTKIIKGNPYLYEVKSVREGDRVRQVFVRYLGRADKPGREYSETEPVERKERIRRPAVATISEAVTPTVAVEAEKLEPKTFTFRGLHFRDIEGGIGLQAQDPNTKEWIDTAVVNRKNLETNYANVPDITLWKDRTPETTIKFPEAIAPPTEEVAAPVERTGQEMRAIRDRLQGERMGWQVPQAEFINIESEVSGSPITPDFSESMVDTHKSLIQKAIREGEDVPTDVLKDYPELTPKPTPTAVEITPTPVTKEPWEITKAERATYIEQKGKEAIQKWNESGGKGFPPSNPERWGVSEVNKAADELGMPWGEGRVAIPQHKYEVMVALKQGKPIPLEVLKDYPELTPKPAPEVMVTPTEPEITPVTPEVSIPDALRPYAQEIQSALDKVPVSLREQIVRIEEKPVGTAAAITGWIEKDKVLYLNPSKLERGRTLENAIVHEVGHLASDIRPTKGLPLGMSDEWYRTQGWELRRGKGGVYREPTEPSKVYNIFSPQEDFAEAFADYILSPESLKGKSPGAFDFMQKYFTTYKEAIPKAKAGMPEVTKEAVTPTEVTPVTPEVVKPLPTFTKEVTRGIIKQGRQTDLAIALGWLDKEGQLTELGKLMLDEPLSNLSPNIRELAVQLRQAVEATPKLPAAIPKVEVVTPEITTPNVFEKDFIERSGQPEFYTPETKIKAKPFTQLISTQYDAGQKMNVRNVHIGKVEGQEAWADGFMLEIKPVPEKLRSVKGYRERAEDTEGKPRDFSNLVPDYSTDGIEVKPILKTDLEAIKGKATFLASEDKSQAISIDSKYVDYFLANYPDAKFITKTGSISSPINIRSKGKTVGTVMPIFKEKSEYDIFLRYVGGGEGVVKTAEPEEPAPEQPVKEPRKPVKVNPEMAGEILEGYRDLEEAREALSDFADRDVVFYTARGDEVTPDMLRQAIDIKSVEPKIKQEPNINALLAHLREAPQSKSTESYLRKTFGDEAIDQAHQDRLVTRTPKGIYTITVSGRETIKSIPSGKVNLYAEGKRILAESITIKPETQEATFEQNITKAVEERPSRISHGYTAKNAFYITKDNRIIPANEFSQVSKGDDIISVHSHSGENWEQYTREHGQESFQPPNAADFDHLRWLVKQGYGNKLAVIMGDGRYIQVEIPEPAQPRFTRMGRKTLEKLLYPSRGASDRDNLAKLKEAAKEEGWLLTEGNWKD